MKAIFCALIITVCLGACKKKKDDTQQTTIAPLGARFNVTGTMQDFGSTQFTGYFPFEMTLTMSGTAQGVMTPKQLGIAGHLISAGGSTSYYGSFGPTITIDPATNKITAMTNSYGQPAPNGRSATLDPSGINAWNPSTKEIRIKYWMDEPAVTTPHRVAFDETWTYLGQ